MPSEKLPPGSGVTERAVPGSSGPQVERVKRMIELGYFDFFGLGLDVLAALDALNAAVRIDMGGSPGGFGLPVDEKGT